MRHLLLYASLMATAASSAMALDGPLRAEDFEAYVLGKTLFYSSQGTAYGAEQYLPGHRVIWTFLDGECRHGTWYETQGQICFVYDADPEPQCWSFWEGAEGLTARFENTPEATELFEVKQSPDPLRCPGPEVGV